MRYKRILASSLALAMCGAVAGAKDKKKVLLPADVLQARTVLVLIDPNAGVTPEAPNANRAAQENVEKALMKWGRFELVQNATSADLVIMVRRGNGKIAQTTIGGLPTNSRPVIFEPTDSGGRVGGGTVPPMGGTNPAGAQRPDPAPQIEVGSAEDMFEVYRGRRNDVLDSPAVWRYGAKNGLESPDVPAVDAFRKLIAAAEKQQASNP
ncbi:MAG TPA: hypothetical protein VKB38_20780 [Terracidiphilus sp.]|nr:hypothetical protein [Terracidiphilus sp.]